MIGAHDLARRAGITYRQLDHWTRIGLLTPVHRDIQWRGIPREYPDDQLPIAETMGRLVEAGVSPQRAREIVGTLLADGHVRLGPFLLVRVAA